MHKTICQTEARILSILSISNDAGRGLMDGVLLTQHIISNSNPAAAITHCTTRQKLSLLAPSVYTMPGRLTG